MAGAVSVRNWRRETTERDSHTPGHGPHHENQGLGWTRGSISWESSREPVGAGPHREGGTLPHGDRAIDWPRDRSSHGVGGCDTQAGMETCKALAPHHSSESEPMS